VRRPPDKATPPEGGATTSTTGYRTSGTTENGSRPVEVSPLRQLLDKAAANEGCSMKDLTVLAVQNDPFRVDTPAGHRDGEWLATTATDLGLGARRIHLRGLHYMVIGRPKPDGTQYTNTDEDWLWLAGKAGKAARWLGYIPFDQIVDQRNAVPAVRKFEPPDPQPYLSVGARVDIPDVDAWYPRPNSTGSPAPSPTSW
jgi:hypothetical protein